MYFCIRIYIYRLFKQDGINIFINHGNSVDFVKQHFGTGNL